MGNDGMKTKTKTNILRIPITDMVHMGGEFTLGKKVAKDGLFVKYTGELTFETVKYYVYVRKSFWGASELTGIAVPLYQNWDSALQACIRLNKDYVAAVQANRNNIRGLRRRRAWSFLLTGILMLFAMVRCVVLINRILSFGFAWYTWVEIILYLSMIGLCYAIRVRLQ